MSTARRINTDLGFIPMKTIEDMKQNAELILGDSVLVSDNLTVYKIVSEVQPIKLNNNLYAKVLVSSEDIKQNILNLSNEKLNKGSLPATIIDAKGIYDLLENNGGINIDTALLYLNDTGTKTQGKVYFDKNKKGLFECIKTTTSTVNSTEFFVDISNKASSDRLRNLGTLKVQYENSSGTSSLITLKENMDNYTDIIFVFKYNGGVKMTQQMPVSQFKLYSFGYDMRGGENADRNYGAQILYKSNSSVQATGRITIFKVILKK